MPSINEMTNELLATCEPDVLHRLEEISAKAKAEPDWTDGPVELLDLYETTFGTI